MGGGSHTSMKNCFLKTAVKGGVLAPQSEMFDHYALTLALISQMLYSAKKVARGSQGFSLEKITQLYFL